MKEKKKKKRNITPIAGGNLAQCIKVRKKVGLPHRMRPI